MRAKVGEPQMAGYLGENGSAVHIDLFLEEKELFALLAGYEVGEKTGIGKHIWVYVKIKKEMGDK